MRRGGGRQLRERLPHHHETRREPCRIHERDEVAGALERGGVVEVEVEAAPGLEPLDRGEHAAEARHGLLVRDQAELVGGDGRRDVEAHRGRGGVVADLRLRRVGAAHEADVVDGQAVLAVRERGEPAPGVARDPPEQLLVVRAAAWCDRSAACSASPRGAPGCGASPPRGRRATPPTCASSARGPGRRASRSRMASPGGAAATSGVSAIATHGRARRLPAAGPARRRGGLCRGQRGAAESERSDRTCEFRSHPPPRIQGTSAKRWTCESPFVPGSRA